jgi:hypothetical protein
MLNIQMIWETQDGWKKFECLHMMSQCRAYFENRIGELFVSASPIGLCVRSIVETEVSVGIRWVLFPSYQYNEVMPV